MNEKTHVTPYDTAEYLKTEEDIAAYFDACLEEAGDDPAFIARALGDIARARHDSGGERCWACTREPVQSIVR
jgi:probable addiction module antidote protein